MKFGLYKIGNDFSKRHLCLDLLPGVDMWRGSYQTDIQLYSIDSAGTHHVDHSSIVNHGGKFLFEFGADVYKIEYVIYCHNSFPQNPRFYKRFSFRVDELIIANLAVKLLRKSYRFP